MTMNDDERRNFVSMLGMDPDADALSPAKTTKKSTKPAEAAADPTTIPVKDIVFDTDRILAPFAGNIRNNRTQAKQMLFWEYRQKGNSDRNKALFRECERVISELVEAEIKALTADGGDHVKEKIQAQNLGVDDATLALAKALAAKNITADDLKTLMEAE